MPNYRRRARRGSGTAYQRPDGLWIAERTIDGKRLRRSAPTEGLARARLARASGPVRRMPEDDALLRDYLPAWVARQTDRKAKTRHGYASIVTNHLLPSLGGYRLSELRPSKVRELLADLAAMGLSVGTRRNVRNVLSGAMQEALGDDLILSNPARAAGIGNANSLATVQVSLRDAQRVLDALMPSPHSDLLRLQLYEGLRFGEAAGLDWSDVRLAKPSTLRIWRTWGFVEDAEGRLTAGWTSTKSNKVRVIPLVDEAAALLWSRYERMGRPKVGLVFPSHRDPTRPVPNRTALSALHAALAAAGLPQMRQHDLRHWCLTILLGRGLPPPTVSAIAGHANPAITLAIYAHVFTEGDHIAASQAMTFFPKRSRRKGENPAPTPHQGGLSHTPHPAPDGPS
jgi:integrase